MGNAKETYVCDDINDLFGVQTEIYFDGIDSIGKRGLELIDQLKKYGWKVAGLEDRRGILVVTINQSCTINDIVEDFFIKGLLDVARWRKITDHLIMSDGEYHYELKYKGRWVNLDKQKRARSINTSHSVNNFFGSTSGGSGASTSWSGSTFMHP